MLHHFVAFLRKDVLHIVTMIISVCVFKHNNKHSKKN